MTKDNVKHDSDTKNLRLICVNCTAPADSLYTEYSKEVIRITECKHCGEYVDKYIEYDVVLVFIDLILQYGAAYRHFLVNTSDKIPYLRLATLFLLCNAYKKWIERRAATLDEPARIYDLEWTFYESLLQSCIEMVTYILIVTLCSIVAGSTVVYKKFMQASLTGFYGIIFLVFSIIWKLHRHWTYRTLTSLFIFISHVQVQRSLSTDLSTSINIIIVTISFIIEKLVGYLITQSLHAM